MPLTPGEYTQLTGRAGRRGIDVEGHAVVLWHSGRGTRRGRRAGLHPHVPAAQFVRAVVQHDDQPGEPDGPDAGAQAAGAVVRAVPGGPLGGRPGARHRARRADARRDRRRTGRARRARCWTTRGCARRSRNGSGPSRGRRGCSGAGPSTTRWPRCAAATSSTSPTGAAAGWPSSSNPPATATIRGRWCSPKTVGRAGFRRPTTRARRRSVGSMTLPKRVEHRQPRVRRDLASALRSAAAGACRSHQGQAKRRRRRTRRRSRTGGAARAAARPPGAPTRRPRGEGPARRAVPAHRARQRGDPAEGGRGDQLAGPDVRPDRRAAHRTRLHRRDDRR